MIIYQISVEINDFIRGETFIKNTDQFFFNRDKAYKIRDGLAKLFVESDLTKLCNMEYSVREVEVIE